MGTVKADRQEKWLGRIAFFEPLDRRFRKVAIDEIVICPGGLRPAEPVFVARLNFDFACTGRRIRTLIFERRAEIPSLRVIHAFQARRDAEMKNLAAASGGVAVLPKQMG